MLSFIVQKQLVNSIKAHCFLNLFVSRRPSIIEKVYGQYVNVSLMKIDHSHPCGPYTLMTELMVPDDL